MKAWIYKGKIYFIAIEDVDISDMGPIYDVSNDDVDTLSEAMHLVEVATRHAEKVNNRIVAKLKKNS